MTTTNLGMTKPTVGADSDTWGGELNADLDLIDAFAGKLMPGAEVTVASASTCDIGAAASTAVAISGTTTITSFGTVANCIRFVRFTGALTLTHNGTSLILLKGANRITAIGAVGIYRSDSSGNWRELEYFDQDVSMAAAAKFSNLALGAISIGSNVLAVGGSAYVSGDTVGGNFYAQPNGYGAFVSKGFGVTTTFQGPSLVTDYGGGFTVTTISGGVLLPAGGTSWTAVSERAKKKNLRSIPGDPFAILASHDVKLGHYLDDDSRAPLRPFLFYEDAINSYPWAATTVSEHTIVDPKNDEERIIPAFKGVSLELYVPLLVSAFKKQIELNALLESRIRTLEEK